MARISRIVALAFLMLLGGCATYKPNNLEDACDIFRGKKSWYRDAVKASKRWGTPVATKLAFIHQESRFVHDARPPRKRILWIIPGPRPSDAFGYAQVKDDTWRWYQQKTGKRGADRDEFTDVVDFIGWYNLETQRRLGIAAGDPYRQYLAYHEGHGGYERATYKKKPWLDKVARKVAARAKRYQLQLQSCQKELSRKRFLFF